MKMSLTAEPLFSIGGAKIEPLTHNNWLNWSVRARAILINKDNWNVVNPESKEKQVLGKKTDKAGAQLMLMITQDVLQDVKQNKDPREF